MTRKLPCQYVTSGMLFGIHAHSSDACVDLQRAFSRKTAIKTEDVVSTLQHLELIKYWKGQVGVLVRGRSATSPDAWLVSST